MCSVTDFSGGFIDTCKQDRQSIFFLQFSFLSFVSSHFVFSVTVTKRDETDEWFKPITDPPHRSPTPILHHQYSVWLRYRLLVFSVTEGRSKPTTKDDDSLDPHGVSSVFSVTEGGSKPTTDPNPPRRTTFLSLRHKKVPISPTTTSLSLSLSWRRLLRRCKATTDDVCFGPHGVSSDDAKPPRTTLASVLTASPTTSVSVLTEITSQVINFLTSFILISVLKII